MREPVDATRVRAFAHEVARRVSRPVTVYLVGGATAVVEGWRSSTIDIDLRVDPDLDEVLRAVVDAKRVLDLNLEFVSPSDFVPELPGWEDRSPFVLSEGGVTVRHFDPYSQALAKLERGFTQDLDDVRAMQDRGWLDVAIARRLYAEAEDWLFRYPAVNAASLRAAIDAAFPA